MMVVEVTIGASWAIAITTHVTGIGTPLPLALPFLQAAFVFTLPDIISSPNLLP